MITKRRIAEKISFKILPETCPAVDDYLDSIKPGHIIEKEQIEGLRTLVKSKTTALRELSFKYIESSLDI